MHYIEIAGGELQLNASIKKNNHFMLYDIYRAIQKRKVESKIMYNFN